MSNEEKLKLLIQFLLTELRHIHSKHGSTLDTAFRVKNFCEENGIKYEDY